MHHEERQAGFSAVLLSICILIFFYWFVCRHFLSNGTVPGDLGDARFNIYVLEHLFRWLTGRDASLASPEMLYPFPGSLYFSDTHFGSALFYVIFRLTGVDEYRSFTLWFFIGYLLTFAASYFVALRLGYNSVLSAIIATIFSFSLPCFAQFTHAQLMYRFPVPLAFLSCWSFVRTGSITHILRLVIWISLEMLCGIYLGVFLTLAVIVFISSSLLIRRGWRSVGELINDCISDTRQILQNRKIQTGVLLIIAAIAAVAAAAVLAEYESWAVLYGFKRSWKEIATYLPRPSSYLIMDHLAYWKAIDQSLIHAEVPGRGEQNIFVGVGVLCLFTVGVGSIFAAKSNDSNRLARSALATIVVLALLTTMFGDYSAYYLLTFIPGFDSIRAVARISLVVMFPVALVAAEGARTLIKTAPRTPGVVVLALFFAISVLEILMVEKPGFRIAEAERRVAAVVEEARRISAGKSDPILSLMEDWEPPYVNHLDAMLAAQRLGWPTSNGYSGNYPPGYEYEVNENSQVVLFEAYERWRAVHKTGPDLKVADLIGRDLQIGSSHCSGAAAPSFGPPPAFDSARQIRLLPGLLERHDSRLNLEVIIHSQYDRCVRVTSSAPVRLSWRFVPPGYDDEKDPMKIGWDTRLQISRDIVPERNLEMKLVADLPAKPGTYNIEFSLVAENSFWFHDKGMKILRFEDALTVP